MLNIYFVFTTIILNIYYLLINKIKFISTEKKKQLFIIFFIRVTCHQIYDQQMFFENFGKFYYRFYDLG